MLNSQVAIEKEILDYYGTLMGKGDDELQSIDMISMRRGPQLSRAQRLELEKLITEVEIMVALKGIHDILNPFSFSLSIKVLRHIPTFI